MNASTLYAGLVVHRRLAPRRHRLRYRLFQLLLDLDDIPDLARRTRLFSHNRFNLFSFHDKDHGDRSGAPLRPYVEDVLSRAGILTEVGRIGLLCMPRMFGHVFNPISIYYCHDRNGRLAAMLYEVTNTYHERHSYVVSVADTDTGFIRQTCAKAFFVSPFMDMDMTYEFTVSRPDAAISTTVRGRDADGAPMIVATFQGRGEAVTDRTLLRAFLTHPLMTAKVVAAIHLEAGRLFLKGVRLRHHPVPPQHAVTLGVDTPAASQNHQAISLTA